MADIFREIDEDVRRDRALDAWKKHGSKFIALAVLAVLGTAGWTAYQKWQVSKAEEAGARYEEALQLAKGGNASEAETAFAAISKDAPAGYASLAHFREAAEIAKSDREKGIKAFETLAADSSLPAVMRDVARLRGGMLAIDTVSREDLKARLDPLLVPGNVFGPSARELLGLAALKAGDFEAAGKFFDEIVTDKSAPPSLKQRADLLLAVVRAGPVKPAS
jgi:hypothetical protein